MFQDGIIAQAIDQVVAAGVTYFSAAANNGHKGYEASFVAGTSQTVNGKAETFHAYSSGNIFMPFTLAAGRTATVVLEWNQPAGSVSPGHASASDLDLFVTDNSASHLLVGGSIAYNIGNDPIEGVQFTNNTGVAQTYNIVVGLVSGSVAPTDFKIVTFNGNGTVGNNFASNTNDGTIYGHAAAIGAIAVGAAYYGQTPAYGVSPPIVESYSSGGPTRILFDTVGNPINVVRQGPAITAPDGGDTSFFGGGDSDGDGFPNFFGTSAAAPAAAAVAALMLQLNPSLTPAAIKALLMNSAIDMDNPATAGFDFGFDAGTGAGLIQADKAILAAQPAAGSVSIDDVSLTEGDGGATIATFTVTRTGGTAAFDVNYATSDGSAKVSDSDYIGVSGTLHFVANVNAQTISITINGDSRFEPDENFFITLSGATNGAVISDSVGTGTIINDDVNHPPVVSIPSANVSASAGQVFAASSLFSASDIDNDVLTYFLYDGTVNGGHFVVNGTQIADQTVVALSAAQVAQTTFVAGSSGSTDALGVMVYDGHTYSGNTSFSQFSVSVAGVNHAPVVTIPQANVAASAGQVFAASGLFSASDIDNDVLTYFLYDATAGANSGHFEVNGSAVPAQTVVALSAAQVAQTTFVAGMPGSNDDFQVMAYDGHDYSGNTSFSHFHILA
jgi:Calx-beta domain/Subtilase family